MQGAVLLSTALVYTLLMGPANWCIEKIALSQPLLSWGESVQCSFKWKATSSPTAAIAWRQHTEPSSHYFHETNNICFLFLRSSAVFWVCSWTRAAEFCGSCCALICHHGSLSGDVLNCETGGLWQYTVIDRSFWQHLVMDLFVYGLRDAAFAGAGRSRILYSATLHSSQSQYLCSLS